MRKVGCGLVPHVDVMGFEAMLAAYQQGQPWLDSVLPYLEANRDYLSDFATPGVSPGAGCRRLHSKSDSRIDHGCEH